MPSERQYVGDGFSDFPIIIGPPPVLTQAGGKATFVSQGRQVARIGEQMYFRVIWAEFRLISSPVTTAYKNGTNVSSDVLSGSEVSSGNQQTTRKITIPTGYGGSTVVIELTITSGRETRKSAVIIDILSPGQEGG